MVWKAGPPGPRRRAEPLILSAAADLRDNQGFCPCATRIASYYFYSKPIMLCRSGCGACCIAPSISSPIPGMPHGKPAGVRCIQLDAANRCQIFGQSGRPAVCASLAPSPAMCGADNQQALRYLTDLEALTCPAIGH
jgi:hypothetical protein